MSDFAVTSSAKVILTSDTGTGSSSSITKESKASPTTKLTWTLLKAVGFSSLGGVLFGYDLGVISGALPQITAAFNLTESQQESVVSFLYLGGGVGAAVGGYMCDLWGRKFSILVTDLVFAAGAIILYTSQSYTSVLGGRFVVGFAVAVSGCADVSYLSEISPVQWRGSIVSRNEACITFGFLMAYAAGYGFTVVDPNNGWRSMFGVSAIVSMVQVMGMLTMPESPVWLASQDRVDEAKISLMRVYEFASLDEANHYYNTEFQYIVASEEIGSNNAHSNDNNIDDSHDAFEQNNKKQEEEESKWKQLFRQSTVTIFLSVVQQFCGHTNVLNFAPIIFANAGMGQESSLASIILLGTFKFVVTIFVIWKIDAIGRLFLLLFGMCLIEISLIFLTVAFAYNDDSNNNSISINLAIIGAIGMATGYASSFGPLTWLITSEMFPSSVRGRALGASTILSNVCAALVSYTFLSVSSRFGAAAPFAAYAIITLLAIIFSIIAIPDTGSKSPTNIHADIQSMRFWRFLDSISFTRFASAQSAAPHPTEKEMNNLKSTLLS